MSLNNNLRAIRCESEAEYYSLETRAIQWILENEGTKCTRWSTPAWDSSGKWLFPTEERIEGMLTAGEYARIEQVLDFHYELPNNIVEYNNLVNAGYMTGHGYAISLQENDQNTWDRYYNQLVRANVPDDWPVKFKDKNGVMRELPCGAFKEMINDAGQYFIEVVWQSLNQVPMD